MADKMYTKPGPFGSTLLYNSQGQVVGKGTSGPGGSTIFTGTRGEFVGKSSPGLFGESKLFDADNRYRGTSVNNFSDGFTTFDCAGSDFDED